MSLTSFRFFYVLPAFILFAHSSHFLPLPLLLRPEELWIKGEQRSLLDARLFPVLHPRGGALGVEGGAGWLLGGPGSLQRWRESWRLSLREVLSLTRQEAELQWREELLVLAGRKRVTDALQSRSNVCLLPCFRAAVLGGHQGTLLETLDNSESMQKSLISKSEDYK